MNLKNLKIDEIMRIKMIKKKKKKYFISMDCYFENDFVCFQMNVKIKIDLKKKKNEIEKE